MFVLKSTLNKKVVFLCENALGANKTTSEYNWIDKNKQKLYPR